MLEILIVDDDDLVRESLGLVFRREGFAVTLAASGEQALQAASEQSFELVLVDIRMPGMDGLQVVARLRERLSDAHFVLITGYASEAAAVEALRLRVDDYIRKPFDMQAFMERIRGICRDRLRQRQVDPARVLRGLAEHLQTTLPHWKAHVMPIAAACRTAGQRLGLDPVELETLELAALFHDVINLEEKGASVFPDDDPPEAVSRVEQVAHLVACLARPPRNGMPLAAAILACTRAVAQGSSLEGVDPRVLDEVQTALRQEGGAASAVEPAVTPRRLEIRTLGETSIRVSGQEIPADAWETSRARWLFLHLLAQRGRRLSQERLSATFWPEGDPKRAHRSLLATVHRARKALGLNDAITTGDRYYAFNAAESYWWDVEELERSYRHAQALEAASDAAGALQQYLQVEKLYRGPFLEECPDEWTDELRESTRRVAGDALLRIGRVLLDRDPAASEQRARRALLLEPTEEGAHALLIRALAAQGRRDDAVRSYHKCSETLQRLLDLPPGPEVTRAYLEAREG